MFILMIGLVFIVYIHLCTCVCNRVLHHGIPTRCPLIFFFFFFAFLLVCSLTFWITVILTVLTELFFFLFFFSFLLVCSHVLDHGDPDGELAARRVGEEDR